MRLFHLAYVTMIVAAVFSSVGNESRAEDEPAEARSPSQPPEKQRPRPQPEKVVDIAADTATHAEGETLAIEFKRLTGMKIRDDGFLLACDADANIIKIINLAGKQVGTIDVPFKPEALDIREDGTLFCGGEGQLAKLDSDGQILKQVAVPDDVLPSSKDTDPAPARRRRGGSKPKHISGIAASDQDVFVAFGSGWSTSSKSKLYRFDSELETPVMLAEGLRGCCQRCDIKTRDGVLYLAENAAHRVVRYDRDGQVLTKWGQRGRDNLETFGACCNPMNICFDGKGVLYTSESGLGRVKRYSAEGEFVDLVGYVGTERFLRGSGLAASCSNMAIAVTPDAQRVYVMDYKNNRIRVLNEK